ncbi:uncharacterized protein LOC143037122 [Oratosquilla oratoria]|uniref:uncharacterized protein LOC143037122 n=1 Tax=Oratosquilla oratoria TaxID=337810 RepID=UPI003F774B68
MMNGIGSKLMEKKPSQIQKPSGDDTKSMKGVRDGEIRKLLKKDRLAVAFALVAIALARPDNLPNYSYSPPSHHDSRESLEYFETPKYEFTHAVKDEESYNDFGHQEARDDEHTQGSYYVQLPDGRLQKVTYYVDGDSGFVAEVSYEGEARYPEPDSSEERNVYAPPPPRNLYGAPN